MRRASEVERRRLNELFAELCAIPSVSGQEGAIAERVTRELTALGFQVQDDGAGPVVGSESGNLVARLPGRSERTVLLCAHLDTVPHQGPIEPVLRDGGWESAGDTILGADNKAAVAVLLALAHRVAIEGAPVGIELLLTVKEEVGLLGASAVDRVTLRSDLGFVFDHPGPIGEIAVAAPTYYRLTAAFHGAAAHAGLQPEQGRSAIIAAARAVSSMRLGRLDEQTTANVGTIAGGVGTNIVPERCTLTAEARSLDEVVAEATIAALVDRCYDAANDPECECDVDVTVERVVVGYRHGANAPGVVAAEAALRACGYTPSHVSPGIGTDANALGLLGLPCVVLGNGTERPHEPDERVSQSALEGMLDVTFALLDELAESPAAGTSISAG